MTTLWGPLCGVHYKVFKALFGSWNFGGIHGEFLSWNFVRMFFGDSPNREISLQITPWRNFNG